MTDIKEIVKARRASASPLWAEYKRLADLAFEAARAADLASEVFHTGPHPAGYWCLEERGEEPLVRLLLAARKTKRLALAAASRMYFSAYYTQMPNQISNPQFNPTMDWSAGWRLAGVK